MQRVQTMRCGMSMQRAPTLPWRGRVASSSVARRAGWGEQVISSNEKVTPPRLTPSAFADPPPPGEGGSKRRGHARPSRLEMLRQLQPLRLVVGADAGAVERVGPRDHLLVDEAADDLPVLDDERHLARAHFEHRAAAAPAGARVAEA